MKNGIEKSQRIRNLFFFVLLVLAARSGFAVFATTGMVCALLGLSLIILTIRLKETKVRKVFFILTGASAAGPIFAILHNVPLVQNFWQDRGISDEPVFFILAVLVFPALYLIATAGSIILLLKTKKTVKQVQEQNPTQA